MKKIGKISLALALINLSVTSVHATLIGTVKPPPGVGGSGYGSLTEFLANVVLLIISGAAVFAMFNFVLAGYSFLSAGDDPKKIAGAWAKIYQSIIGIAVALLSVAIAAVVGFILFGEWDAMLTISIYGP